MDEIPKKFPKLRWAFIEVSAQWLPYTYNISNCGSPAKTGNSQATR